MYADVVLGVDHGVFEDILENHKNLNAYSLDTDLTAEDWLEVIGEYKSAVESETGKPFPQDTGEQLWGAIAAVFGSWQNTRAITYRRLHAIPDDWGTAVNVQAMVFGNMGDDVGHGRRLHAQPIDRRARALRRVPGQCAGRGRGGRHPHAPAADGSGAQGGRRDGAVTRSADAGDVQRAVAASSRAWSSTTATCRMWSSRSRTGKPVDAADALGQAHDEAALKIAVDLVRGRRRSTPDEALLRVDAAALDQLLHPTIDPGSPSSTCWPRGLPASPGAAAGEIVFDPDEAETLKGQGREVILVRIETSPGGHPRHARGGRHSDHARRHDEPRRRRGARHGPAVRVGRRRAAHRLQGRHHDRRQPRDFRKGDVITIDGSHGPGARRAA